MPELPEVELVTRALDRVVSGKQIESAELLRPRLAPDSQPTEFAEKLQGCRVNFIHRRGKNILFDLDNGLTLLTHLRMSGCFLHLPPEMEDPKFTHAIFHFADGSRLVFQDQRHFGLMKIIDTYKLAQDASIAKLAPEPFSDAFSTDYLIEMLRRSSRSLKEFLLDQTKVCGLGNIYASEAMFAAGIHPATPANRLAKKKIEPLHAAIISVLNIAISHANGLPVNPENLESGYFSGAGESWMVYDREGEPCRTCKTPITRLKQGGRSTYFCRNCQRK